MHQTRLSKACWSWTELASLLAHWPWLQPAWEVQTWTSAGGLSFYTMHFLTVCISAHYPWEADSELPGSWVRLSRITWRMITRSQNVVAACQRLPLGCLGLGLWSCRGSHCMFIPRLFLPGPVSPVSSASCSLSERGEILLPYSVSGPSDCGNKEYVCTLIKWFIVVKYT